MSRIILPGLIDPHVHLRDPGQTNKEDFYTGTLAALAGGFTTILDMPNNKTPITTLERLKEKKEIAQKKIVCDVGFYFGSLGDNLEEFEKIVGQVFGLKLYLNITTGHFLIGTEKLYEIYLAWSNALMRSRSADLPILVHSEDDTVAKVLQVVKKTGQKTHFCHVSSRMELSQIIKAKEEGLPVTCGVTPHHLFLNEEDIKKLKGYAMMKPPLRTKKDVQYLWDKLSYVDVIESDHAPHTSKEKSGDNLPSGVPGLETTLPLLLKAEQKRRITLERIIALCSENPAKIFNLKIDKKTKIEVDLKDYIFDSKNLKTKCAWTPFDGWDVRGQVKKVYMRGQKIYENGKLLVSPGFGQVISPTEILLPFNLI